MFLVDPNNAVLSTANIPPQRQDWWLEEWLEDTPLADLPPEVFMCIMDFVDWPLSWKQAVKIREKLMAERTAINDLNIEHSVVS
jgi:hypothetical protein